MTSLLVQGVGPVPQLLGYDGRNGGIGIHDPFTFIQKGFLLGAVVQTLGFVAAVPAFVFWVFQYVANGKLIERIPLPAGIAHLVEPLRNLTDAKTVVGVQIKNRSDNFCFSFVDGHDAVLLAVAVELVIAQHPAVFDGLAKAELDPLR